MKRRKGTVLSVRISPQVRRQLRYLARVEERNMSQTVRWLIKTAYREHWRSLARSPRWWEVWRW